jgi:hypothetical protein
MLPKMPRFAERFNIAESYRSVSRLMQRDVIPRKTDATSNRAAHDSKRLSQQPKLLGRRVAATLVQRCYRQPLTSCAALFGIIYP